MQHPCVLLVDVLFVTRQRLKEINHLTPAQSTIANLTIGLSPLQIGEGWVRRRRSRGEVQTNEKFRITLHHTTHDLSELYAQRSVLSAWMMTCPTMMILSHYPG